MVARACSWPRERQVEIDHRRLQGTVTQILLDHSQIDPCFEQVCRVAVPQRVDRDPLAEAEVSHHALHRAVNARTGHRFGGRAGLILVAAGRWKQPDWVAMRDPVLSRSTVKVRGGSGT